MLKFAGLAISMAFLSACASDPQKVFLPDVEVPLSRFTTGSSSFLYFSGLNASARQVVRTQLEWRALWNDMYKRNSTVPPLPEIDFSREEILVAALGERGSSGYSIVIESASVNSDGDVDVVVRIGTPGGGCGALTVLTQPVDIARIPRTSSAIQFVDHSDVAECAR